MAGWRGLIALGALILSAGCAGQGSFLGAADQTFTTLPPTAIVVLYSPGSERELGPEHCAGPAGLVPLGILGGGGAVPASIRALPDTGGEILVYADCSLARGHVKAAAFEAMRPEPCFASGAEPASGYVEVKSCRRLDDLERLVQEVKRNVPPQRIFVAGSGVGGWAALLAAKNPYRKFNAAIAIDPRIAGPGVLKDEHWEAAEARHRAWLGDLGALPALVVEAEAEDPAADARAIRAFIDCRLADPTASCARAAGES
jgi:hypothetical protein